MFGADGEALTLRFCPAGDGPWRLRATAGGADPVPYAVEAWDLAPLGVQDLREAL